LGARSEGLMTHLRRRKRESCRAPLERASGGSWKWSPTRMAEELGAGL
jgi:hypothetical protein